MCSYKIYPIKHHSLKENPSEASVKSQQGNDLVRWITGKSQGNQNAKNAKASRWAHTGDIKVEDDTTMLEVFLCQPAMWHGGEFDSFKKLSGEMTDK